MPAGKWNIKITQGKTFDEYLTVGALTDPNDPNSFAGWDLSGYSCRMQVRQSAESSEALLDLSVGNGITLSTGTNNIHIVVAASAIAALPVGKWQHELELTYPSGKVIGLLEGSFRVYPEIVR